MALTVLRSYAAFWEKGGVFYTLDPAWINRALIKGFEYNCKLLQIIGEQLGAFAVKSPT